MLTSQSLHSFSSLSQYLCSKCGSILRAPDKKFDVSTLVEDCPNCGAYLANTLTLQKVEAAILPSLPKFQTAFDLTRFKIDIDKINKFMTLSSTGSLCISGVHANLLLTRLCVRSLLPANHGGLGSPFVIIVDAGNKSDFYQTVNFAKQYGMNLKTTLDRIVVSRTFTIYQLKSLLLRELPKVIEKYRPSVVIVPGLLDLFDDPNIKRKEAKIVIARIMKALNALADKMLVITSLQETNYAKLVMPSFDKRIALSNVSNNRLDIDLYNGKSKANVSLPARELKLVQRK